MEETGNLLEQEFKLEIRANTIPCGLITVIITKNSFYVNIHSHYFIQSSQDGLSVYNRLLMALVSSCSCVTLSLVCELDAVIASNTQNMAKGWEVNFKIRP